MANWYATETSGGQGLVIEEGTGRNIAVTYEAHDARAVAEVPAMVEALRKSYDWLIAAEADEPEDWDNPELRADIENIAAILARIEGERGQ